MFPFRRFQVRTWEMGLLFCEGDFQRLLPAGTHLLFDPRRRLQVDIVSQRDPWLVHDKLDLIIRSGVLADHAAVLDLQDTQRALVWIDNRFSHLLPTGPVRVLDRFAPGSRGSGRCAFGAISARAAAIHRPLAASISGA